MENIYSTALPFYWLAKVLGVFPITFENHTKRVVLRTKWIDVMFSSSAVILLVAFIAIKFNTETLIRIESSILERAWDLSLVFGFELLLVQLFFQILKRDKIAVFLSQLHAFDCQVSY